MGNTSSTDGAKPAVQYGCHILHVQPGSPGEACGLKAYFDLVLSAQGVHLDSEKDEGKLVEILKANLHQSVRLMVYNLKTETLREVAITPSDSWGGAGFAGITIRYCSSESALDTVWHVLEVQPNSPASKAGLKEDEDYIIGTHNALLQDAEDLYKMIAAYENKNLTLFVYNIHTDNTRLLNLVPDKNWGGQGSVGCTFGSGYLHRIPRTKRANDMHHDHSHNHGHSHSHGHSHDDHSHSHGHSHDKHRVYDDHLHKHSHDDHSHSHGHSHDEHSHSHEDTHDDHSHEGHSHSHSHDGHSHKQPHEHEEHHVQKPHKEHKQHKEGKHKHKESDNHSHSHDHSHSHAHDDHSHCSDHESDHSHSHTHSHDENNLVHDDHSHSHSHDDHSHSHAHSHEEPHATEEPQTPRGPPPVYEEVSVHASGSDAPQIITKKKEATPPLSPEVSFVQTNFQNLSMLSPIDHPEFQPQPIPPFSPIFAQPPTEAENAPDTSLQEIPLDESQ